MQPQKADHLDAPPPLPPRPLYVNIPIKAERAYSSLQCESDQQNNPSVQPLTDNRPITEAQKRFIIFTCSYNFSIIKNVLYIGILV